MNITQEIHEIIEKSLPVEELHVLDPQNDQTHLQAIVISKVFENQSLVKRHKLVMNALKQQFATNLHALALKTYTPEEWVQMRSH